MAINIRDLEDYKRYLSDLGWSDEKIAENAEYRFSDFKGEQITYRLMPDGSWQWQELIDTGGYWEKIPDLTEHLLFYFRYKEGEGFRCVCDDSQFLMLQLVENPEGSDYKYRHEELQDCVCCIHNKTDRGIPS